VWSARKVRDPALAATLRDHGVDLLLNVHSLFIAHAVVVAAPRVGSFNVHPGPLPAYAGLNAPSWAIYHGETMHAVTIHWMDEGIDSGHIANQTPVAITGRDTGYSLSAKCTRQALRLLENLLAAAAQGADAIPRLPQGGGVRRYHGREAPRSGRLDWRAPARQVVDFIRAADYSPFPSPWGPPRTWADGQELGVVSAATTGRPADAPPGTVGPASEPGVLVAAGDEWVAVRRVRLGETLVDARSVMECGRRLTSDAPTV
jgi:UDP-4-amino-4-deoxy-L-arabinose formyltransferase/UDP-glucuronic acid dehydrogenase (UDP-4-keto-hexauronic acid decarboxylating)